MENFLIFAFSVLIFIGATIAVIVLYCLIRLDRIIELWSRNESKKPPHKAGQEEVNDGEL